MTTTHLTFADAEYHARVAQLDPVQYLESMDYEFCERPLAVIRPIMEFLDPDVSTLYRRHSPAFCDRCANLCSGDGYRWAPPMEAVRFR